SRTRLIKKGALRLLSWALHFGRRFRLIGHSPCSRQLQNAMIVAFWATPPLVLVMVHVPLVPVPAAPGTNEPPTVKPAGIPPLIRLPNTAAPHHSVVGPL